MADWITVKEAAEILKISERQVRNRATGGKLKAKRERNKWLIHHSLSEVESEPVGIRAEVSEVPIGTTISDEAISRLETDNTWLRSRVEELEQQLSGTRKAAEEASQRHDTIVLQLTRQLENQQLMLEAHTAPWYRRWFRKRRAEGE